MTGKPFADYGERLVSRSPVTIMRRVMWGECDPAQVVYTPRFADYLATAFTWFRREIIDTIETPLASLGLEMPMKALTLDFDHVLRPNDLFQMKVYILNVSDTTFTAAIVATSLDDRLMFRGTLTPVCVATTHFKRVNMPLAVRDVLMAYGHAHPRPDEAPAKQLY